jgi:hypothetical protein
LETYPIEASNEKIRPKNSIKIDDQNHHMEDKKEKGKGKERSKDVQLTKTKERKELIPLEIRSYLIHSPSCCLHANQEI